MSSMPIVKLEATDWLVRPRYFQAGRPARRYTRAFAENRGGRPRQGTEQQDQRRHRLHVGCAHKRTRADEQRHPDQSDDHTRHLITELQARLGDDVRVEVHMVDRLEPAANGKFKWVTSHVPLGI